MNPNTRIHIQNKARMINAALTIWEQGGEKAVTAAAVGTALGISRQRVCKVWGTMDALRSTAALYAVRTGRAGVLEHLRTSGHPAIKKKEPA